jgi:parvulin-like peptidyl-prolyl isomerase
VRRPSLLLVAGLVAVLLLAGCGSGGAGTQGAAAKVDGTVISNKSFQDDLQALADNKKFVAALQQGQNVNITPTEGTISSSVSAQWLNLLINQEIVDQAFDKRHLKVNSQDEAASKQQAAQVFGGASNFAAFPKWFQDEMVQRQQRVAALTAALPSAAPSDAQLQQFFTENMPCTSGLLVEHILVGSEPEANEVEAELAGGSDFATLAKTRSIDTGSAQTGGELWCTSSQEFQQADQDFRNGAQGLQAGQTSPPVKTQFGYHVIRVVPWTFDNARPLVEAQFKQQTESSLAKLINAALFKADIWVDPRYGTVRKTNGTVVVQPPTAPNPKQRPPASTTPATGNPSAGNPSTGNPSTGNGSTGSSPSP